MSQARHHRAGKIQGKGRQEESDGEDVLEGLSWTYPGQAEIPPGLLATPCPQVKGGWRSGWLPTRCLIQQLIQKQETTGRGCRSEQHLIDWSAGQETGTRQGLYKETHVSDYIVCAEAVKGLCEVRFSLGEEIFLLSKLKWGTTEGPISRFGGVIRVDMCYDMAVRQLPHLDPESGSEEGEQCVYETERRQTDVFWVCIILEEIYILQGSEETVRAAFNFSFLIFFLLKYIWFSMLCSFLLHSKVTQLYTYIILFNILFHYALSKNIEYSSCAIQ